MNERTNAKVQSYVYTNKYKHRPAAQASLRTLVGPLMRTLDSFSQASNTRNGVEYCRVNGTHRLNDNRGEHADIFRGDGNTVFVVRLHGPEPCLIASPPVRHPAASASGLRDGTRCDHSNNDCINVYFLR